MFLTSVLFILVIIKCEAVWKTDFNNYDGFYKCFENAIALEGRYQFSYLTYVISDNQDTKSKSILKINFPMMILKDEVHDDKFQFYISHMYVFHVETNQDFLSKFHKLSNSDTWNPKAKFWVLIPNFSKNLMRFIFKQLWGKNIVNVVIFSQTSSGTNITTWFPYKGTKCGGVIGKLRTINRCDVNGKLLFGRKLFPKKIPKDLHGCPVKILYIRWLPSVIDPESKSYPGYEVEIMKLVEQITNVTFKYVHHNDNDTGVRDASGMWSNMLGQLQNNSGEYLYGSIENTYDKQLDFDLSKVYAINSMVWVVPAAALRNNKHIFRLIFDNTVWLLLMSAVLVMGMILWAYSVLHQERSEYSTSHFIATNLVRLFTSESMPYGPAATTVRAFYTFCFFTSLLLTTYYNAIVYGLIAYPVYEKQINSLKQLLNSNIPIGLHPIYEDIFRINASRRLNNRVLANFEKCPSIAICIEKVYEGNFATVTDLFLFELYSSKYPKVNLKSAFHTFPIRQYFISAVARRGFPLMERFNDVIYRINDFGFMKLIAHKFQTWVELQNMWNDRDREEHLKINIEHLIGPIKFCAISMLFAGFVLILEIVHFRIFNGRK